MEPVKFVAVLKTYHCIGLSRNVIVPLPSNAPNAE